MVEEQEVKEMNINEPVSKDLEVSTMIHYRTDENGSRIILDDLDSENLVVKEKLSQRQRHSCCDKIRNFMRTHFPVLSNPRFILYFFQIGTMAICIQCVLTFLPDLGILRKFDKNLSAVLLSIVGGSDMLGRFLLGFIFDIKMFRTRRRLLHSILGVTFSSVAMLFGFCQTYVHFVIICVVWGIIEGGYHSQRATVVSEFTSKHEASSAISFTIAAQGIGNLLGPPVAGNGCRKIKF